MVLWVLWYAGGLTAAPCSLPLARANKNEKRPQDLRLQASDFRLRISVLQVCRFSVCQRMSLKYLFWVIFSKKIFFSSYISAEWVFLTEIGGRNGFSRRKRVVKLSEMIKIRKKDKFRFARRKIVVFFDKNRRKRSFWPQNAENKKQKTKSGLWCNTYLTKGTKDATITRSSFRSSVGRAAHS